jgi:hypothetical protein
MPPKSAQKKSSSIVISMLRLHTNNALMHALTVPMNAWLSAVIAIAYAMSSVVMLYAHALESIFVYGSLSKQCRLMFVSRSWCSTVLSMHSDEKEDANDNKLDDGDEDEEEEENGDKQNDDDEETQKCTMKTIEVNLPAAELKALCAYLARLRHTHTHTHIHTH